jgi:nitrogen fixation NifU-like protein
MDDLYRQLIIDRYKNPLYRGALDPHDIAFEDDNPLCGDHIRIELRLDGAQVVKEAAFEGHGCAISQASADLLMEAVIGKTLEEVKAISKDDLLALLGLDLGPVRL